MITDPIYQLITRTYNPKEAIALDRFVHKLTGKDDEVIERNSTQSAATMKEAGITLDMSVKSLFKKFHIFFQCTKAHIYQVSRECEIKQCTSDLVWISPQPSLAAVRLKIEENEIFFCQVVAV